MVEIKREKESPNQAKSAFSNGPKVSDEKIKETKVTEKSPLKKKREESDSSQSSSDSDSDDDRRRSDKKKIKSKK